MIREKVSEDLSHTTEASRRYKEMVIENLLKQADEVG